MTCVHHDGPDSERSRGGRPPSSARTANPRREGDGDRAATASSSRAPIDPGDSTRARHHRRRYTAGVVQLLRLVAVLTLLFLLLPLLDMRVRGRTNRARYVQIVIVSILLLGFLIAGRRWT